MNYLSLTIKGITVCKFEPHEGPWAQKVDNQTIGKANNSNLYLLLSN